jgi:protein AATF/BFR2
VDVNLQSDEVDDEDIDSDEAFADSDEDLQRQFKFLGSSMKKVANGNAGQDTLSDDDMESELEDEEQSEVEDGSESNISGVMDTEMQDSSLSDSAEEDIEEEESDDASVESDESSEESAEPTDGRATLRKLMASDQKTVAATISQAAKADATKGQAVKRQRSTFDLLLNTRIKLQKGLGAMNSLPATRDVEDEAQQAIEAAEKAAMTLWSALDNLRQDLAKVHYTDISKTGQKRIQPSASAPSEELWAHMRSLESTFVPQRRAVLNKWSSKVRAATVSDGRGKLLPRAEEQGITAVLDTQLTTEADKLIQRTKISRSGTQPKNQIEPLTAESPSIFDDTDFYQLLLRELVEQRMNSSSAQGGAVPIATSLRATRVKKNVDTRASKGRKMRYTVHEKLQNFMAPEDRGTWTENARDEFFGSLLGGRAGKALREDNDEESEREEQEVEALRLFRM